MIRPFTCVCMLLAGAAGLYLYQSKHQAQMLDREIARTVKQASAARERTGLLGAEYALLNEPQRLSDLADQHLPGLKKTAPTQFTTWADFEKRLPPVGAPAVEAAPLEPDAPAAKLPDPLAAPPPEAVRPAPPARPAVIASATPAVAVTAVPRPAPRPAAAAQGSPPAVPAPRPASAAQSSPAAAPAPRPAAAPVSLTASLQTPPLPARSPPPRPLQASAPPARLAPPPAPRAAPAYTPPSGSAGEAVARIARGAPVDPTVPAVASALGMARSMMAAPPVTPASAATIWQPGGNAR